MFDFSLVSKRKRKNAAIVTKAKSPEKEQPPPLILPEENIEPEKVEIKEEGIFIFRFKFLLFLYFIFR